MPIPGSLRDRLGITHAAPAGGGCIHECYRTSAGFLKTNKPGFADAFAAEADGLEALRRAGLRAPAPLAHGVEEDRAFLLMELLDLSPRGDFAALGRMLAHAHRIPGPRFGWQRDNYIGATPQQNGWSDSWADFWWTRRMAPQLALATEKGFVLKAPPLELLQQHEPQPSLLHGDLWSGNVGFTRDGPAVFDPAVYYGDREADLAMTELFGGFPPAFYAAYDEAFPRDEGYARRKPLYNLYHLLNHLNLFGGGYLAQVQETLRLLLRG